MIIIGYLMCVCHRPLGALASETLWDRSSYCAHFTDKERRDAAGVTVTLWLSYQ